MDISGYYDLATKRFTSALDDNSSVSIPQLVAGEDITVRAKFRTTREGAIDEIKPTVVAMRATLGQVDWPPLVGKIKLTVDGDEFEDAITFDTLADTNPFEAELKEALESLDGITDVSVTKQFSSYLVVFEDDPTIERNVEVTFNTLFPSAFLRVRSFIRSGQYHYELRPIKAPVGHTNTFSLGVGPLPTITVLREGGTAEDTSWSEIQKLTIPPSFIGTFRMKRGEMRTDPLSRDSTLEEITASIEAIKDPGGVWGTSVPIDNTVYIEFGGDMTGIDQDSIEIEIFDQPPPEHVVSFTTKTRGMADLMMEFDRAALVLEVYALLTDLENEEDNRWHCILRAPVAVNEAVDWDELATAPEIDWLNPPTLLRTRVFSPSQVSNGQLHYTETIGDESGTSFEITHGLDTPFVDVIILENQTPGAKKVEGVDYTWTRDNDDQVTINWLTGVPSNDEFTVTILALAQTSFFDPHTHTFEDVDGLVEWMSSVENRFSMLLANTAIGASKDAAIGGAEAARWALPDIFELYPSRVQPERPGDGILANVDLNQEDEEGVKIINRGKGLLPAVHNASVLTLPVPVPAAAAGYVGNVYQNQTSGNITIGGGYGLRTQTLKPGEHVACDGRIWYPVVSHGRWQTQAFDTDFSEEPLRIRFTDELAEQLAAGRAVEVSSTGTLPTGLSSGTTYYVRNPDYAARTCSLALTPNGEPIELSGNGTGTHTILTENNITWYPRHFERVFATISVNDKQLRPSKDFYVGFGFEAVLLRNNVDAQLAVMVEIGEARKEDTDGREGDNLEEIVWRRVPALDQVIVLSAITTTHKFGFKISRRISNGIEKMLCNSMIYGAEEFGAVPPRTANFLLRISMGKFDTSNGESDSRGLLMFSGFKIGNPDDESTNAVGSYEMGAAYVR